MIFKFLESSIISDPSISGSFWSCQVLVMNSQPCLSFKNRWAVGKLPEGGGGDTEGKEKSTSNKQGKRGDLGKQKQIE